MTSAAMGHLAVHYIFINRDHSTRATDKEAKLELGRDR